MRWTLPVGLLESGEPQFLRFPSSPSSQFNTTIIVITITNTITMADAKFAAITNLCLPGSVRYVGLSERLRTFLHNSGLVQFTHMDLLQAQGEICQGWGPGEQQWWWWVGDIGILPGPVHATLHHWPWREGWLYGGSRLPKVPTHICSHCKGRSQKKTTGKCGNFSQMGDPPPSPLFGNDMFFF